MLTAGDCFQLVQCEVIELAFIKITLVVKELFAETGFSLTMTLWAGRSGEVSRLRFSESDVT